MADDNAVELLKRGDRRFSKRQQLDSFRQEIALNFAPHHASWTTQLNLGDDFASHLIDGTPLIIADDYIGMIGSMLRPAGKQWFWHRSQDDELNQEPEVRTYLDWRSTQMNRIVFDRVTGAEAALDEADEFYGLFGDAVLMVDYATHARDRLMVQHYHSKDAVWAIGKNNKPDTITRKEYLPARVVQARFSQKGLDKPLHEKIIEAAEKDGDREFEIRHEVLPANEYDSYVTKSAMKRKDGWVSVWIDVTHKKVIRETHQETFRYVIPRAGRRYGYPYGISRATMIALPDARLLQQQAMAILDAAEKQVNPPLIATSDAIRGDIRLDGITWVDRQYDERNGDPLRVLELGKHFNLGIDAVMRTEQQLARAFKLDRLRFPDTRRSKTREEAAFMIDEFVRASLPIFGPMKVEYNDEFLYECDRLIELADGYKDKKRPEALGDQDLTFAWDNPLTDMLERQKIQKVAEVAQVGQTITAYEAAAAQAPSLQQIDASKMFREAVMAAGAASWLVSERQAKKNKAEGMQALQQQQMMAAAPNIAQVVKEGAQAAQIASEIPAGAEPGYPVLPAPM